jgi:hypothetical protein
LGPHASLPETIVSDAPPIPQRQIRAAQDGRTVRVYQAYGDAIADAALAHGRFVSPPFSMERMTWIKPSFLWMMYRSGWGRKDERQRRILAVDLCREGFEWALAHGRPTHRDPAAPEEAGRAPRAAPVMIQWDPERDLDLRPLPHRTIQIGLRGEAVARYVGAWTVGIADVTALAHRIHAHVAAGRRREAEALLPVETVFVPGVPVPGLDPPA